MDPHDPALGGSPMTFEEYEAQRQAAKEKFWDKNLIPFFFLIFFLFIAATECVSMILDGVNGGDIFLFLLNIGLAAIVVWTSIDDVKDLRGELADLRSRCLQGLSPEEKAAFQKRETRKKRSCRWVVIAAAAGILALVILVNLNTLTAYGRGLSCLRREDFAGADQAFSSIKDENFLDTFALARYSASRVAFQNGNPIQAHRLTRDYMGKDLVFHISPPWLGNQIARYKLALEKPYQAALDRLEEEHKKAEEQRLAELGTKLPYCGMAQSDIYNTALGDPAERYTKEMYIDQKLKTVTYYEFQKDGKTYFSVECVDGQVTKVRQYTKEEMEKKPAYRPQATEDDDPYDAADYYDPEDFYEDHYDDFYDYDEAEEYYYDHN